MLTERKDLSGCTGHRLKWMVTWFVTSRQKIMVKILELNKLTNL